MAAAPLMIAASLFSAGAAVRLSKGSGNTPGMPALPTAPTPIDTRADQALAAQRALQARTQAQRRAAAPTGRSSTFLTAPGGASGSAPVQRQTLLGL